MKKILSFILTAVMLLSMIPAFAVSASAETAARTPLNVEFVSSTENYHGEETTPKDLSIIFNPANATRTGLMSTTDIEVIGKLSEPTQITSFVIRSHYYRDRVTGMVVSFSTDGETWTKGYTLQETRTKTGVEDVEIKTPDDTTKYSYVRISKKALLGDAATNTIWFDIHHIVFYSETESAPSTVKAVHYKTLTTATSENLDKFFDYSNTTLCGVSGRTKEPLIVGKLDEPTIITDVYISYNAAYMNNTSIEASVDGEAWVEIAKAGGLWGNAGNTASSTIAHLHVSDTNVYKYVRIVRNQEYGSWNAYSIGFCGTVVPEPPSAVSGYQLAPDGENTYALRIISKVKELDEGVVAQSYGMTIRCAAEDGRKWKFTKTTDTLVGSITGKNGDTETTITAESIEDCVGFYTAVIENIPKDIGVFSVSVTPYVRIDGKKNLGVTKTIVMENNKAATASELYLEEHTDKIKISGRSFDVEDGIACDFAASGIEFNAVTAGTVKIKAECDAVTYYTIYIDGIRQERLKMNAGVGEYTIAENLPAGKHNIKLVKQTHIGLSASTLLSVTMRGELLYKPSDKKLLIEFVGDSITCGYGVVNYPTAGVIKYNTADYADATQAYAYKTADLLDADSSMIAVSGWTLISGDNSVAEDVYDYTSSRRSTTDVYTPNRAADVVVINLGTNDIGSTEYADKFIPEAKAFVAKVREKNPDAVVVFAYGMMMSGDTLDSFEADIQTIVRDLGATDAGVYSVKLPTNQDAGNGHPSIEGHTEAAKILAEFIKENCLG